MPKSKNIPKKTRTKLISEKVDISTNKIKSENSILSIKDKKDICNNLKNKTDNEIISTLLENAARKHLKMPVILQGQVDSLINAREMHIDNPEVLLCLDKAISEFFKGKAISLFKEALNKEFDECDWSSELLVFLSDNLKLKERKPTYVKGKIHQGKIYWQYIYEGETLHINYDKSDSQLKGLPKFKVSYDNFLLFKNAGKRHGNGRITKERFVKCFLDHKKPAAGEIWEELRRKEIINPDGKLSPAWHILSNQIVTLYKIKLNGIKYSDVISHIDSCLNNKEYTRSFSENPDIKIPHREHRNKKQWCDTGNNGQGGRIENIRSDEKSYTHLWDVSIYKELVAHRNTPYEINCLGKDHKFNYDHIPSVQSIKSGCKLRDISERSKYWWVVAIPEKMHTQGETFFKSGKDQENLGFMTNIDCYINLIKDRPTDFGITEVGAIAKALGAFRYLYKRGLDSKTTINFNKTEKFSMAHEPRLFFNRHKEDCDKIDEFFVEQLNQLKC